MSDTPRTDEEVGWVGGELTDREIILSDFARRLELELKDAHQIASKYKGRYFATRELLSESTERAETLERWLAEANARIRRLEEALDLVHPSCRDLCHPRRYQHALGEPCPAEEIVRKAKETLP
jgi:hypothetical protein